MKQLTKNFHRSEFDCKDKNKVPIELKNNLIRLAVNLQVLRDFLGVEIIINSAYRTKEHNIKVGGAPNSQHLYAKASDIKTKHHTPKEVYNAILYLIKEGRMEDGGVGLYKTFVHYDIRGFTARWSE